MITKAERTELRSITRQQFKVLRAEVAQRQAEVLADAEGQISERYADQDKAWSDASQQAHEVILEANRRLNDIYRALDPAWSESMIVMGRLPLQPARRRTELRVIAGATITAKVKAALLQLDRQEADLLRHLAVGALESDEAHAFLQGIPAVGELVPTSRLAELEASLGNSSDERFQ